MFVKKILTLQLLALVFVCFKTKHAEVSIPKLSVGPSHFTFLNSTSLSFFFSEDIQNSLTLKKSIAPFQGFMYSHSEPTSSFRITEEPKDTIPTPRNVKASDGTYKDEIFISWEGDIVDVQFAVYEVDKMGNVKKMISEWIESCFYCGFSDVRDTLRESQIYYYRVTAARNSNDTSSFSKIDSGYLKAVAIQRKDGGK